MWTGAPRARGAGGLALVGRRGCPAYGKHRGPAGQEPRPLRQQCCIKVGIPHRRHGPGRGGFPPASPWWCRRDAVTPRNLCPNGVRALSSQPGRIVRWPATPPPTSEFGLEREPTRAPNRARSRYDRAQSRDRVDAEPQSTDLAGDHHASKLSVDAWIAGSLLRSRRPDSGLGKSPEARLA